MCVCVCVFVRACVRKRMEREREREREREHVGVRDSERIFEHNLTSLRRVQLFHCDQNAQIHG